MALVAPAPLRAELLSQQLPPNVSLQRDSDGDGIGDLDELALGTNPTDPLDGWSDEDNDGLSLAWEFYLTTDPLKFDTDRDGYADGVEVFIYQSNPLSALSVPQPVGSSGGALAFSTLGVQGEPLRPKLSNGDFGELGFTWWRDGTKMTDYMGGGYKWNYGTMAGWTPYVGTKLEVWSAGGETFVELDATTGSYGIKQPIANVRAGHYLVTWQQLGRKSAKAEKNSFKVVVYYLKDEVEQLLAPAFEVASVPTNEWGENACTFHLGAAELAAANGAPVFIAFIPTGTLNSYGTLIDKVALGTVEVFDGSSPLASLPLGEDPWANANILRTIEPNSIAWITGNSGPNQSPEMPNLSVQVTGGSSALEVQWRFECEYHRGNGFRLPYIADFTRPEDRVTIPLAGASTYTLPTLATAGWLISEDQGWQEELDQRGFFGGLAKVFIKLANSPEAEVCRFRIGGQNPDQTVARQFIDTAAGPTFWYAYAIAKHETAGRVRGRFYNHFYTDDLPRNGRIGADANDMGWAARANGWPLYNLDREPSSPGYRQNGPGGYGMFQLTLGPKTPNGSQKDEAFIARRQIWNWQDNCLRAIEELKDKLGLANTLRTQLENAYPDWPKLADIKHGKLNGLEAAVTTFYNGMSGTKLKRIRISPKVAVLSCWRPGTIGTNSAISRVWYFLPNKEGYVDLVLPHIE